MATARGTNAKSAARLAAEHQKARAAAFRRASGQVTAKETARLVTQMQRRALQLTSGTRTERELALLGHPYKRARRRYTERERLARASLRTARLLPINRRSGGLQDAMKVYAVVTRFGERQTVRLRLRNRAPYALFQLDPEGRGTKWMRSRGFWAALMKSFTKADARQIHLARIKAKRRADKYLRSA